MALIMTQAKAWNLLLPHMEFAYKWAPYQTTGLSPFKIVYGLDPLTPRDMIPRPMQGTLSTEAGKSIKEIQELYEKFREKIETSNANY